MNDESLYVIKFSNGILKIGRSKNPESRIKSHKGSVLATAGAEIVSSWSKQGVGCLNKQETMIKRYCMDKWESRSNEWFVDADFEDVVSYADKIDISSDSIAYKSEVSDLEMEEFIDAIHKIPDQRMKTAFAAAKEVQQWIADSGIWFDIFNNIEGKECSMFELTVAIYAHNNPHIAVCEIIDAVASDGYSPESIIGIYETMSEYAQGEVRINELLISEGVV